MGLFSVFDKKKGSSSILPAFSENALRRNLKKENKWDRIPKSIMIRELSQAEVQSMFQAMQAQNAPTEESPTSLVEAMDNAEQTLERLDGIQSELEAIQGEVANA